MRKEKNVFIKEIEQKNKVFDKFDKFDKFDNYLTFGCDKPVL